MPLLLEQMEIPDTICGAHPQCLPFLRYGRCELVLNEEGTHYEPSCPQRTPTRDECLRFHWSDHGTSLDNWTEQLWDEAPDLFADPIRAAVPADVLSLEARIELASGRLERREPIFCLDDLHNKRRKPGEKRRSLTNVGVGVKHLRNGGDRETGLKVVSWRRPGQTNQEIVAGLLREQEAVLVQRRARIGPEWRTEFSDQDEEGDV
jgi:hypothetical protein